MALIPSLTLKMEALCSTEYITDLSEGRSKQPNQRVADLLPHILEIPGLDSFGQILSFLCFSWIHPVMFQNITLSLVTTASFHIPANYILTYLTTIRYRLNYRGAPRFPVGAGIFFLM